MIENKKNVLVWFFFLWFFATDFAFDQSIWNTHIHIKLNVRFFLKKKSKKVKNKKEIIHRFFILKGKLREYFIHGLFFSLCSYEPLIVMLVLSQSALKISLYYLWIDTNNNLLSTSVYSMRL